MKGSTVTSRQIAVIDSARGRHGQGSPDAARPSVGIWPGSRITGCRTSRGARSIPDRRLMRVAAAFNRALRPAADRHAHAK